MRFTIVIAACLGLFVAEAQAIFCAQCPYVKKVPGQPELSFHIPAIIRNAIEQDTKVAKDGYESHPLVTREYTIDRWRSSGLKIVPSAEDKKALESFIEEQIKLAAKGDGVGGIIQRNRYPHIAWAYRIRLIFLCLQDRNCTSFKQAFDAHITSLKGECTETYQKQWGSSNASGKDIAELMVLLALKHKAGMSDEWY